MGSETNLSLPSDDGSCGGGGGSVLKVNTLFEVRRAVHAACRLAWMVGSISQGDGILPTNREWREYNIVNHDRNL